MGVPIRWGNEFLGVIGTARRSKRPVEEADLQVLVLLAAQAATAIRNARLLAEQNEHRRRLDALVKATADLTGTLELQPLVQSLLSSAMAAARQADRGVVLMWDPLRDELRVQAHIGYSNPEIANIASSVGRTLLSWMALDGSPTLLASAEARGNRFSGLVTEPRPTRSAVITGLRFRGKAIGVVVLSSTTADAAFGTSDLDLLTTFAMAAAGAVENARLFTEAQGKAVLEERHRLARALHDSVTQSLYGLTLFAQAALDLSGMRETDKVQANLVSIAQTAQQALKEMRLLVYELRPSELQAEGLVAALRRRVDAVERRAGLVARVVSDGLAAMPPAVEEALYYISQESLNNSLRHAAAGAVTVRLRSGDGYAELEVADDGKGFDPAAPPDSGGLGLTSMRERVQRLGGTVEFVAALGKGTTVRARLPI